MHQEDRCMSYSPEIAEIKRRARASARTTGTSYQLELEKEARSLGYDNWADFLAGKLSKESAGKTFPTKKDEEVSKTKKFSLWRIIEDPMTIVWLAGIVLMISVVVVIFKTIYPSQNENTAYKTFLYNEEKSLAAVLPRLDFADYDRVSYVTAWRTSPGKRKVYITIYDWRPYNAIREDEKDGRYKDVPLVRYQGEVDCKKGILENYAIYSAQDLVSSQVKKIGGGMPFANLNKHETEVICSNETLRKTKNVEAFHQDLKMTK